MLYMQVSVFPVMSTTVGTTTYIQKEDVYDGSFAGRFDYLSKEVMST